MVIPQNNFLRGISQIGGFSGVKEASWCPSCKAQRKLQPCFWLVAMLSGLLAGKVSYPLHTRISLHSSWVSSSGTSWLRSGRDTNGTGLDYEVVKFTECIMYVIVLVHVLCIFVYTLLGCMIWLLLYIAWKVKLNIKKLSREKPRSICMRTRSDIEAVFRP